MEVYFARPDHDVSAVIVGANKGTLLSTTVSCSLEEGDFLKERSRQIHDNGEKIVAFQPFWCQLQKGRSTIVQVADLLRTDLSEIETQEVGAKVFAKASSMGEEEVIVDFSQGCSPEFVAQLAAGFKMRVFVLINTKPSRRRLRKFKRFSSCRTSLRLLRKPLWI